jgi:hypothetical protein
MAEQLRDAGVEVGDIVEVKRLDGELSRAIVVDVLDVPVTDHIISPGGEEIEAYRYWGHTVPPNDPLVRVRYLHRAGEDDWQPSTNRYDFPASKVDTAPLIESEMEGSA